LEDFVWHGSLVRRPRKETELHHESKDSREDDGEGGPWGCGAEALGCGFNEEDKNKEGEHKMQAIANEDTGGGGRGTDNVFVVEGAREWEERADKEDDQEEEKLEDGCEGFFHRCRNEFSAVAESRRL
jgi:hypothetical protein